MRRGLRGALLLLTLGPLLLGTGGVLLPALGVLPGVATAPGIEVGLGPLRAYLATPHALGALLTGLGVGGAATVLSLGLALLLAGALEGGARPARLVVLALPLLLAVPHVSLALGLGSALGPSGWLVRLASPWATGFERPPNWPETPVLGALPLVLGLVLKEAPFLLLAAAASLPLLDLPRQRLVTAGLGYAPVEAWWKVTVPRLLPYLRLPLLAVLVYGTTNVEMAAVLGPSTPPAAAVLLLDGFRDPDLAGRLAASAGTVVLTFGTLLLALPLLLGSRVAARLGRRWRLAGPGAGIVPATAPAGGTLAFLLLAFWALVLLLLVLWSFAGRWPFPALLPGTFDPRAWDAAGLLAPALASAGLSLAAAPAAVALALWEIETRLPGRAPPFWPYLPLVLPQLGFVPGVAVLLVRLNLDGSPVAVVLLHALLALPYAHLLLDQAGAGLDPRYALAARSLGHGPLATFWRVRLPLLRPAVVTALAVAFAVSCGLYLPTLLAGAGRIVTLPVEAVALGAGGDRRVAAALGLVLAVLPLLAFALAAFARRPAHDREGQPT
ncbi:MAG: ABC transporter permease subunit [Geminicoccaceae bacterium]|nr:ABC transporter permease subunit [Geminicoccaceae bacterium]